MTSSVDAKSNSFRRILDRIELASVAVLISSVCATLVMIEILLRLFPSVLPEEARLRIHWREIEEKTSSIRHPYLGFLLPPRQSGTRTGTDFTFTFNTDEHGFRNRPPWPPAAEIVVAGDSMVFGYGVDDAQAWTNRLSERLPVSRIVNLGLIGGAPQQYLRAFESFGVALKPKLFIFGLFPGNDFNDTEQFDNWLNAGSPGNYDVWRFFGGETPSRVKGFLERSYLVVLLRTVRNSFRFPFSGITIESPDGQRLQLAPHAYGRQAAKASPSQATFRRVIAIVERASSLARANGAQFLVLLFPTKEEVYLPLHGHPAPDLVGPVAKALAGRNIPYFDLTAPLQGAARAASAPLYFEIDGHPNDRGYQAIAKAVYDRLAKNRQAYGLTDWDSKPR